MVEQKEGRVKLVAVRVSEEEYDKIVTYAAAHQTSNSEWIRNAIRKQLARECDPRIFPEK